MDPNLEKIRDSNVFAIKKGNIGPAINQAEDYITYILGFGNEEQSEKELTEFVTQVKDIRREARGQRKQKR